MGESKKTSKAGKAYTTESKSMIPEEELTEKESEFKEIPIDEETKKAQDQHDSENMTRIRILLHESCAKLSKRGAGELEYEIGIDDTIDEAYLRIAGNESSGAYSTKWVALAKIQSILEKVPEESFRAIVLRELYLKQSTNNHGYLAAILKAEGVLETLPKQPTIMALKSWEPLLERIDSLKEEEISLPDYIAIAAKERGDKKAQRMAEKKMAKADKTE